MRVICLCVMGWLGAALVGQAVAQPTANAVADTCRSDIDDRKLDARELICLRELGKRASRKGDLLTLQLENGTSRIYRNNSKACDADDARLCLQHWLVAYHPEAHVYAVAIQYYEGSGVELVSARTGNKLLLSGIPYFADDGSRFVVIDNDLGHGGDDDLAIGSIASGSLSLQWRRGRPDGLVEWRHQRWIDNDHAALRVYPAGADQKCPDNDCDAILVRFNDGWVVRRVPATPK